MVTKMDRLSFTLRYWIQCYLPIVKYLSKFVTYSVQKKMSVTSKVTQAWRNISTDDEETPERKFTLKNSLWFGIASLLQQGGDIPIRWGLKKIFLNYCKKWVDF